MLVASGPEARRETLRYTTDYQAARPEPLTRLATALSFYFGDLFAWAHLPAVGLGLLALAGPRRWQPPAAAGVVVALAVATVVTTLRADEQDIPFGSVSPAFALLVIPFLLPAVIGWAVRERDTDLRMLLVLTIPTALVGFVVLSMATSAWVRWGPAAAAVLPLFGVLGAATVTRAEQLRAEQSHRRASRHARASRHDRVRANRILRPVVIAVALTLALTGTHTLRSFRDPSPDRLNLQITEGPLAGLWTDHHFLENCHLATVTAGALRPGAGVLFYGAPGGYTYSRAPMDTNIIWLADFGAANAATVRWLTERDRWPDVVIVHHGVIDRSGGWQALAAEDPLIATVDATYGEASETEMYVVLRRDGTVADLPDDACRAD